MEYQVFSVPPSSVRESWINILRNAYSAPRRRYHTMAHIQSMVGQLDGIADSMNVTGQQLQILQLAIWFHDVVYDIPTESGRNEIESALLFQEYAREAKLVWIAPSRRSSQIPEVENAVIHLILCTLKHTTIPIFPSELQFTKRVTVEKLLQEHATTPHLLENTELIALFLDLDLSVLGMSEDDYDTYAKQIREEYSHYSSTEYNEGRIALLQGFLQRERLYFTDYFYTKYESMARKNIQREIHSLQRAS